MELGGGCIGGVCVKGKMRKTDRPKVDLKWA